jgi:Zn-dependent protease with chaperone function
MKNFFKTAAMLLLIPVLALAVSIGVEAKYNSDLRQSIHDAYPDVEKAKLDALTVQRVLRLAGDDNEYAGLKAEVLLLDAMQVVSVCVVCFSLLFFGLIKIFGQVSRKDRRLLLILFRPSYYVTSIMLALVTLANAALLVGAIYFGESLLIQRVHVKLILLIAIGAVLGSVAVIRAVAATFKQVPEAIRCEVAPADGKLAGFVAQIASDIQAEPADQVIVGDECTFFASQSPISGGGNILSGKTVYVSRPLCEYLSTQELRAILAHELGHFKGLDTEYGKKFAPIYQGLSASLIGLASNSQGAMSFALVPTRLMLGFLFDSFTVSEKKHSRERELAADAVAVGATDAMTFAKALVKTGALMETWSKAITMAQHDAEQDSTANALALCVSHFREAPKEFSGDDYKAMMEAEVPHPYDSHPATKDRLEAIGLKWEEVIASIDYAPEDKAANLFATA